jgi:thioredoxin-related protein
LPVLFEQGSCTECDERHREIPARREPAHALSKLDVAPVDIGSEEPLQTPDGRMTAARAWPRELGVHQAPGLVFFDRPGREVFRTEA